MIDEPPNTRGFSEEAWPPGWDKHEPSPPEDDAAPILRLVEAEQPVAAIDGPKPIILPNLPDGFWEARERLRIIRHAARARLVGPDLVLLAVMCRLSGMVSHELRFNLGPGPGCLNLFGAGVGGTGLGKTLANHCAQDLLLRPWYLSRGDIADPRKFKDGIGVGTGEGLIEAFMGMVDEETGEIHQSGPLKGDPITEKVRRQVRHNAYFFLDEGETLAKLMERNGSTIGQIIRSAWSGTSLGQQNADGERTRFIDRFTYALGLLIGFQPETAQHLLADGAAGTPQRFLWSSGYDLSLPDADFDEVPPFALPIERPDGSPITGIITGPAWLSKDLRSRRRRLLRAEEYVRQLDSHEVAMRCKLAALLAVIDERMQVTGEDWELATMLWDNSTAIRGQLTDLGRREARKAVEDKRTAAVETALATHAKVKTHDAHVERVARRMVRRRTELGPATLREHRQDTAGRDGKFYEEALMLATSKGWLAVNDGRVLVHIAAAA